MSRRPDPGVGAILRAVLDAFLANEFGRTFVAMTDPTTHFVEVALPVTAAWFTTAEGEHEVVPMIRRRAFVEVQFQGTLATTAAEIRAAGSTLLVATTSDDEQQVSRGVRMFRVRTGGRPS